MDALLEREWREVSPYLDAALELEGDELLAWLRELDLLDPRMASRVRGYLIDQARLEKQNFLAENPGFLLHGATLAGQRLGAYTLVNLVGHGGTGTVWRARRSDGRFEGHAAVKLLNAAFVGHPSEQRFIREGSVLAELQHPHIAHLIDAGVSAGSQPYLILEYVEGARIDRYCEARDLTVRQRIVLFLDVLAAVSHAHTHLIVHRDLKPSNILVTEDGVVKLLDFGVAALLQPEHQPVAGLTRDVAPGLTPEYAAPEQLLNEPVTTATDVFGLGLVLYVLLTGRHPAAPDGKSAAQLARLTLDAEPPRPSHVTVDPGRARLLRGDLDNIIAKALRHKPADRYRTAELFAQDLRRYLAQEPVTARPSSLPYRAEKFVRRHLGSVSAAVAVGALLVGAVVLTTLQLFEARNQREAALASARRAEATKDFLQLVLSEFQISGAPLTTTALLERSTALLKVQYADQPDFVSEMLIELAREYGDLLTVKAALVMLGNARDIAREQGDGLLVARAECSMARIEAQGGRMNAIEPHLVNARRALARVASPDVEVLAECMNSEAVLQSARGERSASLALLVRARTTLEEAGATHGIIYNTVLAGIATDLMDAGRVADALPLYQLSVEMHGRNGRGGTRAQLISRQNIAVALYRLGEIRESSAIAREVYARRLALQSDEDLSVSFVVNAAITANRLARYDPVLDRLADVARRAEQAGDVNFYRLASIELARTRLRRGAKRAAVEAPLMLIEETKSGESLPLSTRVLIENVRTELELARGAASAADRRATELLESIGKPATPRPTFLALSMAARAALAVGDAKRAADHARAALRIVEPIARSLDTSADVGDALLLLGRALLVQQQKEAARITLARAERCLNNGYGEEHPRSREARDLRASLPSSRQRAVPVRHSGIIPAK